MLQARVLLQRSWRQIKRDKATTVARVMSNVSSAAIFGSIYWRMGRKQVGVQNRMGLLQVHLCGSVRGDHIPLFQVGVVHPPPPRPAHTHTRHPTIPADDGKALGTAAGKVLLIDRVFRGGPPLVGMDDGACRSLTAVIGESFHQ